MAAATAHIRRISQCVIVVFLVCKATPETCHARPRRLATRFRFISFVSVSRTLIKIRIHSQLPRPASLLPSSISLFGVFFMGAESHHLHVVFFPLMGYGHMIPVMDIARLFAARGVKVTIITTPVNASVFSKAIDPNTQIAIHIIQFPSTEAGLPEGCENINSITSSDLFPNFQKALGMLRPPFEQFLEEHHADCVVSDMFLPWTNDVAVKFGVPRLVFHGTSFFSLCVMDSFNRYAPHKNVTSETEPFTVPGLPDRIEMTRLQLADSTKEDGNESPSKKMMDRAMEADERSFGVIVNSFYELEPAYAEHYKKVMGRKAWHIGPVSLCNRDVADKAQRGMKASIDRHECFMSWLDSKKPKSVLYICFGSASSFPNSQLRELAVGLEASCHQFIWVVRKEEKSEEPQWLPQGFELRMEGRGLIIRGWAPQVLILDHQAIGGFMTHCGWNSILEGVSYGVPMITWPVFAEQFYNEKLVTEILRIGIKVGSPEWIRWVSWRQEEKVLVKREAIEKAVSELMDDGEEAEQMRSRAWKFREMAKQADEEGGSSYTDLSSLIDELTMLRQQ